MTRDFTVHGELKTYMCYAVESKEIFKATQQKSEDEN